jgi:hypothetical protein
VNILHKFLNGFIHGSVMGLFVEIGSGFGSKPDRIHNTGEKKNYEYSEKCIFSHYLRELVFASKIVKLAGNVYKGKDTVEI